MWNRERQVLGIIKHFAPGASHFLADGPQVLFQFVLDPDFIAGSFPVAIDHGGFKFPGEGKNDFLRFTYTDNQFTAQIAPGLPKGFDGFYDEPGTERMYTAVAKPGNAMKKTGVKYIDWNHLMVETGGFVKCFVVVHPEILPVPQDGPVFHAGHLNGFKPPAIIFAKIYG